MSILSDDVAGVVIADARRAGYPLTYVSPGFETLTGYAADQVLGRNCSLLQGADTDAGAVDELRHALATGVEVCVTLLNYRADGTPFWNEVTLAPYRGADGAIEQYLGVQRDVTARIDAEARVHRLAHYDDLTGLANRASLRGALHAAINDAASRRGEVALLFVDLDDFKRVNDRHGHLVGDALLSAVANRLRAVVRPRDLLARLGGDEFALLVRGLDGDSSRLVVDLAGRLVDALRDPVAAGGEEVAVRASVGASIFPRDARDADDLLRHADAAMYVAKAAGKDGFRLHSAARAVHAPAAAVSAQAIDDRPLLAELLSIDGVHAVYQPIVDIASGRVVAYEALARGPEGSPLATPDRLFAAARAAGRVAELDWACRIAAVRGALDAQLGSSAALFVNCEPTAIDAPCPERHQAIWRRASQELDIVLEITERALTDRPAELWHAVSAHREAGRGVALDDVGADVRSLALLPLVEPDVIKLDLRLVQDRPSTEQAAIVSAVSAERERTGAAILAEGVETDAHLAVARSLGATLGQGWRWGRPGPLPRGAENAPLARTAVARVHQGRTPFEVVQLEREVGEATKSLLLPMSHHLEQRAMRIGEGAVILSAFQHARHFTPATRRRYEMLERGASLVAAFGVDLEPEPVPGVRGAPLPAGDALADEWSVVVVGPHFAGALVARDLGDDGPDADRRFLFATVYDRALVIAAARTLLKRIAPR